MWLFMDSVPVVQEVWVFLTSNGAPIESFLVVTLEVLKDPVDPVRWPTHGFAGDLGNVW